MVSVLSGRGGVIVSRAIPVAVMWARKVRRLFKLRSWAHRQAVVLEARAIEILQVGAELGRNFAQQVFPRNGAHIEPCEHRWQRSVLEGGEVGHRVRVIGIQTDGWLRSLGSEQTWVS